MLSLVICVVVLVLCVYGIKAVKGNTKEQMERMYDDPIPKDDEMPDDVEE